MDLFKDVLHIKGYFVKDHKLRYYGGDVYSYNDQDTDSWSYFEDCGLVKLMDS